MPDDDPRLVLAQRLRSLREEQWRDKKISREDAVKEISRRYQEFATIFEEAQASRGIEERRKLA